MILAQMTGLESVSAITLKDVVIIVIVLGIFIYQSITFFERKKTRKQSISPQPLKVEHAEKFVSQTECAIHREDIIRRLDEQDKSRAEISKKMTEAEHTARVRSAGIYSKMEEMRKELTNNTNELRSEMNRNFNDTERTLGRIEGKLNKD